MKTLASQKSNPTESCARASRPVKLGRLGRFAGLGLLAFASAAGLTAGGCASRNHLTPTYGKSYHDAFAMQAGNPSPKSDDPRYVEGLDSQESSIVAENYRKGLGPKEGGSAATQPMVIMNPDAKQTAPNMPPPSVPSR